ncbi:alpha/beta hydrolase [Nocardiopsis gilva YIM 90087]|uniref:Alpha/beta hydrolase n=1 Tax=Nocardiopsis gilva YIM 90087 TaxID=1235441 RepID=A0A223S7N4_9ACTN|nr:alpha/beta hydrolase [Nocardiopsis gilva]ASU84116.1 alpha/beta hydrolase [Nocardiopsis gilva YIM 90087]
MTTDESFIHVNGRRLAYLDFGGEGPPLLALHGHFSRGRIFAPLARALSRRYRVIALDQRAHGRSDHGGDLRPEAYVADAAALLRQLGLRQAAVLGHSMGGVIAYRLAARHRDLVGALIVVDIGTVNQEPEVQPVLDVSGWPRRAASRDALAAAIAAQGVPAWFFMDSAVEFDDGWGLLFDYQDMMASQQSLIGDHGEHWCSAAQPALLLRGGDSFMLAADRARTMARERPDVETVVFPGCGHWLYAEEPDRFARAVGDFLDRRYAGTR